MEPELQDLIEEYREQSQYSFTIGNVDASHVYDRVIEDLERILQG